VAKSAAPEIVERIAALRDVIEYHTER